MEEDVGEQAAICKQNVTIFKFKMKLSEFKTLIIHKICLTRGEYLCIIIVRMMI